MTQAWNLSQLANNVNSSGKLDVTTGVTGATPIANGGTNNTATATAGGVVYGTGTAMATTTAGTSGQVLTSGGASAPSWTTISAGGALNNIQYFTAGGTYTATSGTSFVVVEVVGGGGGGGGGGTFPGPGGTGGTSSFGSLVSATGGAGNNGVGGVGVSGDLNIRGNYAPSNLVGGTSMFAGSGYQNVAPYPNSGAGGGSSSGSAGAGGGYARKKITSAFSGVTVTVGSAGTVGSGSGQYVAGATGIVIVYEYK